MKYSNCARFLVVIVSGMDFDLIVDGMEVEPVGRAVVARACRSIASKMPKVSRRSSYKTFEDCML